MTIATTQLLEQYDQLSPAQQSEVFHALLAKNRTQLLYLFRDTKTVEALLKPLETERKPRIPGGLRGAITYMAPDFDEPLEDFKDYM